MTKIAKKIPSFSFIPSVATASSSIPNKFAPLGYTRQLGIYRA
jgi:hypothetical protein